MHAWLDFVEPFQWNVDKRFIKLFCFEGNLIRALLNSLNGHASTFFMCTHKNGCSTRTLDRIFFKEMQSHFVCAHKNSHSTWMLAWIFLSLFYEMLIRSVYAFFVLRVYLIIALLNNLNGRSCTFFLCPHTKMAVVHERLLRFCWAFSMKCR